MARPGAGGGAGGVSCPCPEGLDESGDTKSGVLGFLADGAALDSGNGAEDCDTCVKDANDDNDGVKLMLAVVVGMVATEGASADAGSTWPWFLCNTFSILWPIVSLPGALTGVSVSRSCMER